MSKCIGNNGPHQASAALVRHLAKVATDGHMAVLKGKMTMCPCTTGLSPVDCLPPYTFVKHDRELHSFQITRAGPLTRLANFKNTHTRESISKQTTERWCEKLQQSFLNSHKLIFNFFPSVLLFDLPAQSLQPTPSHVTSAKRSGCSSHGKGTEPNPAWEIMMQAPDSKNRPMCLSVLQGSNIPAYHKSKRLN